MYQKKTAPAEYRLPLPIIVTTLIIMAFSSIIIFAYQLSKESVQAANTPALDLCRKRPVSKAPCTERLTSVEPTPNKQMRPVKFSRQKE
jgi:hypothetical protein